MEGVEEMEGMEVVRGWWRGVVVVEGLEGVKGEDTWKCSP